MSNNSGTNETFTKQQIQQCQEIVQNLRVHELHQLLSIFRYPKLGKKQELVQRAQSVLSNPKYQAKAAQKVFEIQTNNRIREAMHPYSPSGNINGSVHQHPGQQHQFSAVGGAQMPVAAPPLSSVGIGGGMLHPGSAAAAASGMARTSAGGPAFGQPQQIFANANAAAYAAANLAASYHQFFQQMAPHNFSGGPPQHHQQQHQQQLMAAAAVSQQQQLHQQNGQPQQQIGGGGHGGAAAQQQQHIHNQYQRQQQQQPPAVVPQHGAGGHRVCDLRTVELPFYDQIKTIVPMTELPPYPVPTRPGDGRASHSFGVPNEDLQKVHYRTEELPLPRYELQLRMFLLETSEVQQDAFPPGSVLRLDEYQVQLPQVIPTNKPNAEQRRYPRPVNITPYAQPPRGRDRPHRLNFEWNGDKRAWAFTVTLVKRLNSDILLDRILKNSNARRPLDKTKQMIVRRLNGDEDDVQMDSLKISLTDPLMRTRIKIPSRAAECTHLQCFDLNSYLMMSEKRPTWKCPVCDRNAIYSMLIIDSYFEQVLSNVSGSVDEVELLRDGSWRLPMEAEAMGVDSDDAATTADGDGMDGNAAAAPAKAIAVGDDDDDVIMLSVPVVKRRVVGSGGGDLSAFDAFTKQSSSSAAGVVQQQKRMPSSTAAVAPTPDIDIICLSSDDEGEEEAGQMERAIEASTRQMLGSCGGGGGVENGKEAVDRGGGTGDSAAGTSSSSSNSADSTSSSSVNSNSSAAPTTAASSTAQDGGSDASAGPETVVVGGAGAAQDVAPGDRHPPRSSSGGGAGAPSANNSPTLRVNGVHPSIFRPTIDQAAKRHIAHNLAIFLQHVCAKNNKS